MDGISAAIAGMTFGLVIVMYLRMLVQEQRLSRLAQVNAKLDALLKQAGIDFDPLANLSAEVHDAIKRGDKLEAIRLYREGTGAPLAESKDIVEQAQRRAGL